MFFIFGFVGFVRSFVEFVFFFFELRGIIGVYWIILVFDNNNVMKISCLFEGVVKIILI